MWDSQSRCGNWSLAMAVCAFVSIIIGFIINSATNGLLYALLGMMSAVPLAFAAIGLSIIAFVRSDKRKATAIVGLVVAILVNAFVIMVFIAFIKVIAGVIPSP